MRKSRWGRLKFTELFPGAYQIKPSFTILLRKISEMMRKIIYIFSFLRQLEIDEGGILWLYTCYASLFLLALAMASVHLRSKLITVKCDLCAVSMVNTTYRKFQKHLEVYHKSALCKAFNSQQFSSLNLAANYGVVSKIRKITNQWSLKLCC
jgi:hypothetical protein